MQENDQAQVLTIYICARARLFFDKTSLQQKNSVHSAGISRQKFFLLFFSFENDRQRRQKSRRTDSTRGNIQWHSGHRTKWSSSARNVDGRKRCRALSLSLSACCSECRAKWRRLTTINLDRATFIMGHGTGWCGPRPLIFLTQIPPYPCPSLLLPLPPELAREERVYRRALESQSTHSTHSREHTNTLLLPLSLTNTTKGSLSFSLVIKDVAAKISSACTTHALTHIQQQEGKKEYTIERERGKIHLSDSVQCAGVPLAGSVP